MRYSIYQHGAKALGLNVGNHVIAGNGRTGKVATIGPPCQGAFVEIDGAILTPSQEAYKRMGVPQGTWVPYDSLIKSCKSHKGVPLLDGECKTCKREAEEIVQASLNRINDVCPFCPFCPSDFCRCTPNSD